MHQHYGVDLDAPLDACPAMTGHTWRWFETRVLQLLWDPGSHLHRSVYPPQPTRG